MGGGPVGGWPLSPPRKNFPWGLSLETKPMSKEKFPFKARFGKQIVEVTGRHECGLYRVTGFGLVQGPLVPLEEAQVSPAAFAQWRAFAPSRQWKRQGCFRSEPLDPVERNRRAERARSWLKKTLTGPMPSARVLELARKAGINEWSLRRAKKHLRIKAVKVGGRHRGWGAVWFWTAVSFR